LKGTPADTSYEQQARALLERIGVEDWDTFSAGDLAELAALIEERDQLLVDVCAWQIARGHP